MSADPKEVAYDIVPATVVNMGLFDRLVHTGIVRKDGTIVKCMEDYINGFQVCNWKS